MFPSKQISAVAVVTHRDPFSLLKPKTLTNAAEKATQSGQAPDRTIGAPTQEWAT